MLNIEIVSSPAEEKSRANLDIPPQAPPIFEAFFLGVSDFGSGFHALPATPRDANALFLELTNGAYGNFQARQFSNLTKAQLKAELAMFCQRVQGNLNAVALLYLSTHGFYSSQGYVLCTRDSTLEEGAPKSMVTFGELRTWLAPIQEYPVVIVLDSCRNTPITTSRSAEHNLLQSEPPQSREDVSLYGENWAILTSASWGELSHECPIPQRGPHGLFTHTLLEVWQQSRLHDPHALNVGLLYERTEQRLLETLQRWNLSIRQNPRCYLGNLKSQNIQLGSWPTSNSKQTRPTLQRRFLRSLALVLVVLGALLIYLTSRIGWNQAPEHKKPFVQKTNLSMGQLSLQAKAVGSKPPEQRFRCSNHRAASDSSSQRSKTCGRCVQRFFQRMSRPLLFHSPLLHATGHRYRGLCQYDDFLLAGKRCAKACNCRYLHYCKAYLSLSFQAGKPSQSEQGKLSTLTSAFQPAGKIPICRGFVSSRSSLRRLRSFYGGTTTKQVVSLCLQRWSK